MEREKYRETEMEREEYRETEMEREKYRETEMEREECRLKYDIPVLENLSCSPILPIREQGQRWDHFPRSLFLDCYKPQVLVDVGKLQILYQEIAGLDLKIYKIKGIYLKYRYYARIKTEYWANE